MSFQAMDLYKKGTAILADSKVPDWEYDARVLLEWTCGINRMDLILEPDKKIEDENGERFLSYIRKRAMHEPLQYLIGEWEFMGLPFKVNPSVLIPRQDTEVLIEWILEKERADSLKDQGLKELHILDVCTGSGCIAISLDCLLKEQGNFIIHTEALDISEDALKTAQENNCLNQGSVQFMKSNMFQQVESTYDVIVSNPPYIPSTVVDGLMAEVVRFEPRIALDGMEDGLHFYRILAKEGKHHLKKGGRLYLEIGHDQGESVPGILRAEGFTQIEVRKDLAGHDRCIRAVFPG